MVLSLESEEVEVVLSLESEVVEVEVVVLHLESQTELGSDQTVHSLSAPVTPGQFLSEVSKSCLKIRDLTRLDHLDQMRIKDDPQGSTMD